MERRSRTLFTRPELVRFWLRDYGLAVAVVAGFCTLTVGLIIWMWSPGGEPERFEEAKVVRFAYYDDRWSRRAVVIVRTRDGTVRQLYASRGKLRHCRPGDSIVVVRRGSALFVGPKGCAAPAARGMSAISTASAPVRSGSSP